MKSKALYSHLNNTFNNLTKGNKYSINQSLEPRSKSPESSKVSIIGKKIESNGLIDATKENCGVHRI